MIVAALAIFTVLSFWFFIYMPGKTLSTILTTLSIVGVIVSSWFIVVNWKDHYGMKQETVTTTKFIYPTSASEQMSPLVYQPIGSSNKHQVYVYRTSADAKKTVHTQADTATKNKVVVTADRPYLEVKTTRWVYKSGAAKFWFGISGQNKAFVKRTNTFHINKDWVVLTATQANQLKKQMGNKAAQAKMKKEGQAYVTAQVTAAMKQDPTMSKAKRAELVKTATAEFQQQAIKKMIAGLK
ncbi:DUF4811 domain-containing protein [Secundilactobacillus kimchicus]|uniref:DUF4811 domain-containing protein n=1 Tax=Secundilactobacillus kimchicus TaxID=528209 RepID=UPI001C025A66|nr:DUF4811 domain-containing protein [Secundilactobacillus kimchicus]MBT9672273.1 DUF4811 domain-containing protein [Secundilactobacillus kimchicus]